MTTPDHEVLIVGAGFSGIGTSVALQEAGIDDHVLVDNGTGFGGTWFWNRYPGIAVDIPSFSYQFSYAMSPEWTRSYAPGAELEAYAEECARRFDLHRRTTFSTEVTGARFDEAEHVWRVSLADTDSGATRTLNVRHIVDGTGVLTIPKTPDIPGVESFAGATVHTARWDDTVPLRGRRVAVIGTGASAVQVIPTIADGVDHLTVFQRTPIWCMARPDFPLPAPFRTFLRYVPAARRVLRALSEAYVEVTFPIAAHYFRPLKMTTALEGVARAYIRSQVDDPVLQDKLTPKYPLGCKRPSFSNEYLSTFNRPNVTLETTAIEEITPTGVRTADGTLHEIDVLILATGFKVFERGNAPKFPLGGRGGQDLGDYWDANRYRAYQGVSVPGFPNYHIMSGPYGYNGSSYFNLVEAQAAHISRALAHARDVGATCVEVKAAAEQRYFDEMMSRRRRQVFFQPGCANANSYYFDEHGDVPLRAALTVEAKWRAHHYPLSAYDFTTCDAERAAAETPVLEAAGA